MTSVNGAAEYMSFERQTSKVDREMKGYCIATYISEGSHMEIADGE